MRLALLRLLGGQAEARDAGDAAHPRPLAPLPDAGPVPDDLGFGPPEEGEDLSPYLARVRTLVGPWSGEPVDPDGLVRLLNPGGSKPPLIWCFNAQKEFAAMAAGLGPDQPLFGMRSLNAAARPGPERQALGFRLAMHYARILLGVPGLIRCSVGGNCQSASIAMRLAMALRDAGRRVDLLVTLEGVPPLPYPGRVALLFGADSERHNPFLQTSSPQDVPPQSIWRTIYRDVGWTVVPGRHGGFFADPAVAPLCAAVARSLAQAAEDEPPRPAPPARLIRIGTPARARCGEALTLTALIADGVGRGASYVVHPRWWSRRHGLWSSASEPLQPIAADRPADLRLATPDGSGPWRLMTFLCRDGTGPVSWHADLEAGHAIELIGRQEGGFDDDGPTHPHPAA